MGFNQTAVKTAVEEFGSGGERAPQPAGPLGLGLRDAGGDAFEQISRRPSAVLCGSYRRGIPSLVRAYEKLSGAGMRVLSPSGLDFVAEIDGFLLNRDEAGIPCEAIEGFPLNCIRSADLVWLHAPDGHVGLSGALEIGFASAAGVPVYAEEVPSDSALRPLVIISPLDEVIARTSTGESDNAGASLLPLQEYYSAVARARTREHRSASDIVELINEEIGELARQNPGQRQRRFRSSKTRAASSG